jgi:hypothetical protein
LANQQIPELTGEIRGGTWGTNIGLLVSCRHLGAPDTEGKTCEHMVVGADLNKPSAKKTCLQQVLFLQTELAYVYAESKPKTENVRHYVCMALKNHS